MRPLRAGASCPMDCVLSDGVLSGREWNREIAVAVLHYEVVVTAKVPTQ